MTYHEEEKKELVIKLRNQIRQLPAFCYEYFRGIEPTTAERTRLGYAYDLKIFFQFLLETLPSLEGKQMNEIQIEDLATVTRCSWKCFWII